MVLWLIIAAVVSVIVVVCDPFFVGRSVIVELLEIVDTVPAWSLTPGDIILWNEDHKYHRTITEVNEGPLVGSLVIEFDDDIDPSWSISPEGADQLVDLYSY